MMGAGKAHVENDDLLVVVRAEESAQRPGEMIRDGPVLRVHFQLYWLVLEMEEGAEWDLRSDATADDADQGGDGAVCAVLRYYYVHVEQVGRVREHFDDLVERA